MKCAKSEREQGFMDFAKCASKVGQPGGVTEALKNAETADTRTQIARAMSQFTKSKTG